MTTKASRRCRTGPSNTGGHGRSFNVAFASVWTKGARRTGVLAYWAATVAVGRTPPRHNANEDRDWRVLAVVNVLVRRGYSERAAVQIVAPEISKSAGGRLFDPSQNSTGPVCEEKTPNFHIDSA